MYVCMYNTCVYICNVYNIFNIKIYINKYTCIYIYIYKCVYVYMQLYT